MAHQIARRWFSVDEYHRMAEASILTEEMADTSVEYDRSVKMPLYARAGIVEAVIINLPDDAIEVYSQPVNGKYQSVRILKRSESFASQSLPGLTLVVDAVLG